MVGVTIEPAAKAEHERDKRDESGPLEAHRREVDAARMVQPRPRPPRRRPGQWWRQFKGDVSGARASVQPLAGWLLLALFAFVAYLTIIYAPEAFEAGERPPGAHRESVITAETGYWTIGVVALLALLVGFEPQLTRRWDGWDRSTGRRWLSPRTWSFLVQTMRFFWRLPSYFWSFLDYLLARPLAMLAGATWRGVSRRYSWGALIMLASAGAGLLAPPPFGLYCVIFAMVLVLAVVRRWTWIETDRQTFLIERGERREREEAQRVGFEEDLRDEALVSLTWLFVLIPLGLRQVQLASCAAGLCAFTLGGGEMPNNLFAQFLAWLGYFGAELAKAVPFVDWSEVFHVANELPIKPKSTLGAQVVFAMRAALDLLLLSAVVTAVQIAGRLGDQNSAFHAGRLPILDPFEEARVVRRAGLEMEDALGLNPARQHSICAFPVAYDRGRLQELVRGDNADMDPISRKAAAALLAQKHPGEETDKFFTDCAKTEADQEMRSWVVTVASGLAPDRDPSRRHADRERLRVLLTDGRGASSVRAAAARALGRMDLDDATTGLLLERLRDRNENLVVRADVGVALAKLQPAEASAAVGELVGLFKGPLKGDELVAAMAVAYSLARLAPSMVAEDIAQEFDEPLRPHALRAARIQPEPMAREPGTSWDQMVRIAPGEGSFPVTFEMGSPDQDDQAYADEKPPREITMQLPFALGRYPVTEEEYLGFCLAMGRAPLTHSNQRRWPVTGVSWRDAMEYCHWLELVTGERYRLPTEAEWEYACRAGTTTRYSWGDEWDDRNAKSNRSKPSHPSDVGSYDPNEWGLWDMHGNVFEFCADPA